MSRIVDDKKIEWMGSSKKDLLAMPAPVVNTFGYVLGLAQNGLSYPDAKTLTQFKSAVVEVLEDHDTDTYRAIYTARFADTVYVLHCFKKKSARQSELPKRDRETIEGRLKDVMAIEESKRKGKGIRK
jgi:phage-related protein